MSSSENVTLTIATAGAHTLTATGMKGSLRYTSAPITVQVGVGGPPAFKLVEPVADAAVDLYEAGGKVTVKLALESGYDYFPYTASISCDGRLITSEKFSSAQYQKTDVRIDNLPLGQRTISVAVADRDGKTQTQPVTVTGRDVAPPRVVVTVPSKDGANIVGDTNGVATAKLEGTATDAQSGMVGGAAKVQWALNPTGTRTTAQAVTGSDFTKWTANVQPLAGFGAHTIYLWATDQAGNTMPDPASFSVVVTSNYVPKTLDERLNERAYLAALLSFTRDHVKTSGTAHADTATLVTVLGQRLDRLSQPLSAEADRGRQDVNELRVPLELLRAHITSTNISTAPGAKREVDYRSAAYNHLLADFGTSYQELRLARGAKSEDRQRLAARLGIRLSATRPDELDQLVLDGGTLTEAALQTLFGLTATTAPDPLGASTTPQMLTWQLSGLALTWAQQDQHPNQPQAFTVLADPDIIAASAVAPGPQGKPIRDLLTQRAALLSSLVTQLDALRNANAANPPAALTAMVGRALRGVDLAKLETNDKQGIDISAALRTAGLTRAGFLYLRELSRLADTGTITPAEWTDAIAVLTDAFKRRQYPIWRGQETGFVLSPDFFVLTDDTPQINPYRTDSAARHDWRAVLRTRIAQHQDLLDGNARAIAATEQAALPILRDALLTNLAATPITADTITAAGEAMSTRFFVDMLAGGTRRTTRIRQAIESLQSLLIAVRSSDLPQSHPAAAWTLNDIDAFTNAWTWMAELGSWRAATMAFLFPERNLDPTLLIPPYTVPPPPDRLRGLPLLYEKIRGSGPFTAADAVSASDIYAKDVGVVLPAGGYLNPTQNPARQTQVCDAIQKKGDVSAVREAGWVVPLLLAQRLQTAGDFQSALELFWIVYPYDEANPKSIFATINTETLSAPNLTFPPNWTARLHPFTLIAGRPAPYTRYTLLCIIKCHLDYADAEFTRETDTSIAHARTLYVTARRLLGAEALKPQKPTNTGEPKLPIPELDALRTRAEVQLAKLRQGRNIAGIPRTQPFGTVTVSQPTPYRLKTLMERATQLAAQATQIEAGYLAALEKYDEKTLRLHDAQKAIDLNLAQVSLAASRVAEAHDAVIAAEAQETKANAMVQTYASAIAAPANQYEQRLLDQYEDMSDLRNQLADVDAAMGILQAAANAGGAGETLTSWGGNWILAGLISGGHVKRAYEQKQQNRLEAQMQANQLKAGLEQRRAEWRMQQTAAHQDSLVAAAQVTVTKHQVTIATQEQDVATLQHQQAIATLEFLNKQFTNADLYQWMSATLGGVYRYFLQQATAIARLAQAQLAFERAEQAQALIRADYWRSPAELTANIGQPDRRGLTGAAQLTADLARLDDYAFSTGQRRLNLSQTFSLARLMPVEFLDFRRTGTLAFATPMALFEADFPGHYQRTIRQERTSVVALVPPDRGIRAELYCSGISRVTTAGRDGRFQDIVLRHDPVLVALTSPVAASGVFELDPHPDMLLPFEGSGVDTTWELRLPPAANPFDFSTIVDVLITIDYTALSDDGYRRQTITRLNANRERGSDCVFSLARDFPDHWYELNNPTNPDARSITITLRDVDFPATIQNITTAALAVRLARTAPVPATVVSLQRGAAGGAATTTDGTASTRRGNAPTWSALSGTSPTGDWKLSFGPDAKPLFGQGGLDDILLVISWAGQAPVWVP